MGSKRSQNTARRAYWSSMLKCTPRRYVTPTAPRAPMRRLAMRFRGMLKSKSVGKLGVWLKDAQKSGL